MLRAKGKRLFVAYLQRRDERNGIRRMLRSAASGFESRGVPRGSNPEVKKKKKRSRCVVARWSARAAGAFGLIFDVGAKGGEVA